MVEEKDIFSSSLTIDLFPHQIQSVRDLERLEKDKMRDLGGRYIETTMGVFGDIPGYGKTLSIVALIDRDKMEWDNNKIFQYEEVEAFGPSSTYITRRIIKKERLDCTLIVASNSLINQWETEIKKSKKLSVHVVTKKSHMDIDPNDYHIVLCSDKMYNRFIEQFFQFAWKRFVYDEASSTHIPSMKSVYAGFYWFITATFPNLSKIGGKNLHFMKNIFRNISQNTFEYMLVKNVDDFVKKSFEMPKIKYFHHKCLVPGILNVIHDMIDNDISQMISAGNIEGAFNKLGGGEGPKNIIQLVTSNKKGELEVAKNKVVEHYDSRNKDKTHKDRYEMWVSRVSEIKDKLAKIKERFSKILQEDCSICSCKLTNPVLIPCCQNIVCITCIHDWLKIKNTCHMCRSEVKLESLIPVKDTISIIIESDSDEEDREIEEKPLPKGETIVRILKKYKGDKFIIFSMYDDSFDIIKSSLNDNDLKYTELKGTRESRDKKLDSYTKGDINIIFLNGNFNSAGINLQNTDHIIYYHSMNELMELQMTGRANRIGRKKSLSIHYLE